MANIGLNLGRLTSKSQNFSYFLRLIGQSYPCLLMGKSLLSSQKGKLGHQFLVSSITSITIHAARSSPRKCANQVFVQVHMWLVSLKTQCVPDALKAHLNSHRGQPGGLHIWRQLRESPHLWKSQLPPVNRLSLSVWGWTINSNDISKSILLSVKKI